MYRVQQHQLPGMAGRPPVEPVKSFTIVDNGVGFTDPNLKSFETADSTEKSARGGKGIGRLTWLIVFEKAEIESQFRGGEDRLRRRSFTFSPTETGISDFSDEALESEETIETQIRLVGVRKHYVEPLRKGLEIIAERVFEHCFNYFVVGNCPRVTVIEHRADGTSWPTTASCRRFRSLMYPILVWIRSVENRTNPSCIMHLLAAQTWTRLLMRRFRAGIEGCISTVKRVFGLNRCQFHLSKNAQEYARRKEDKPRISQALRDIFNAPSREDAEELKDKVVKKFEKIAPEFVRWLEENVDEGLTVFDYPRS